MSLNQQPGTEANLETLKTKPHALPLSPIIPEHEAHALKHFEVPVDDAAGRERSLALDFGVQGGSGCGVSLWFWGCRLWD